MMKLRDEELKRLYAKSLGADRDEKITCLSDEAILRSFTAEMSEEEKLRLVDHVTDCAACRTKFQAAQKILKGAKILAAELEGQSLSKSDTSMFRRQAQKKIRELKAVSEPRKKRNPLQSLKSFFFRYRYASVATGIIMVSLAVWLVVQSPQKITDTMIRGEEGTTVKLETPRGIREKMPSFFRWGAYPEAEEYEVRLLNERLDVVWTSGRIKANQAEFPAILSEALQKGSVYYWKVRVHLKDGSIVESRLQEFKLKN